jgi:hypothetical protein
VSNQSTFTIRVINSRYRTEYKIHQRKVSVGVIDGNSRLPKHNAASSKGCKR